MNTYTERPTDPPEFEDEVWPETDHDAERKALIESDITDKLIEALRDIGKAIK